MIHIPLGIVVGVTVVMLIAAYKIKQSRDDLHNSVQLTIYNRIAQQLTDALSDESLSWNEYVTLLNGLRETHNENLKGRNANRYKLPPMTTLNSMKKMYNDGTNRPVFEPPRRTAPIRRHSQGEQNA